MISRYHTRKQGRVDKRSYTRGHRLLS